MDIPDCMRTEEIRLETLNNEHFGILSEYIVCGWPSTKAEVWNELLPYWSFRDEIVIIDGIAIIGRIIEPASLQNNVLK